MPAGHSRRAPGGLASVRAVLCRRLASASPLPLAYGLNRAVILPRCFCWMLRTVVAG